MAGALMIIGRFVQIIEVIGRLVQRVLFVDVVIGVPDNLTRGSAQPRVVSALGAADVDELVGEKQFLPVDGHGSILTVDGVTSQTKFSLSGTLGRSNRRRGTAPPYADRGFEADQEPRCRHDASLAIASPQVCHSGHA